MLIMCFSILSTIQCIRHIIQFMQLLFFRFFPHHEQILVHILAYSKLLCLQMVFMEAHLGSLSMSHLGLDPLLPCAVRTRRSGVETRREALPLSRLLRVSVFACLPTGPARMQGAADPVTHVGRQAKCRLL